MFASTTSAVHFEFAAAAFPPTKAAVATAPAPAKPPTAVRRAPGLRFGKSKGASVSKLSKTKTKLQRRTVSDGARPAHLSERSSVAHAASFLEELAVELDQHLAAVPVPTPAPMPLVPVHLHLPAFAPPQPACKVKNESMFLPAFGGFASTDADLDCLAADITATFYFDAADADAYADADTTCGGLGLGLALALPDMAMDDTADSLEAPLKQLSLERVAGAATFGQLSCDSEEEAMCSSQLSCGMPPSCVKGSDVPVLPSRAALVFRSQLDVAPTPAGAPSTATPATPAGPAKQHRRHTGDADKPYGCALCPKAFVSLSKLGRHVRTHTGEKPFACSLCPEAFAQKAGLKIHSIKHAKAAAAQPAGTWSLEDKINGFGTGALLAFRQPKH